MRKAILRSAGIAAGLLLALSGFARPGEKVTWKPIPDAILQINALPVKHWNLFQAGKKNDLLLLQLGARSLVIFVKTQQVYEIKPVYLQQKGEDLVWHESDRPAKPLPTSDWSTRDIGSATRIRVKLAAEGRLIDIQIPQMPDMRGVLY